MKVVIKRIYEQPDESDGLRILADRLWPRGLTEKKAAVDLWLKDIAPTAELRKWFGHDPQKWPEFKKRYLTEIRTNRDAVSVLKEKMKEGKITILYAAKDEKHNNVRVLAEYLNGLRNP